MEKNISQEYINTICELYNDIYDDRVKKTCPPAAGNGSGEDWAPGQRAEHKSLSAFQRELQENGIILSTSKIKKTLSQAAVGQQRAVGKSKSCIPVTFPRV